MDTSPGVLLKCSYKTNIKDLFPVMIPAESLQQSQIGKQVNSNWEGSNIKSLLVNRNCEENSYRFGL